MTEPGSKTKWFKKYVFPIILTLIGALSLFFIKRITELKTGELIVLSNKDSVKVYLNGEYKGDVLHSDASNVDIYLLRIHSLLPGNYQILLHRKKYNDVVLNDANINAGYLTSVSGLFIQSEKVPLTEQKVINIKQCSCKPISSEKKVIIGDSAAVISKGVDFSTKENHLTYKLILNITPEIPLEKSVLWVNDKLIGQPLSYRVSLELQPGINKIVLTYRDEIGYSYACTKTFNLSSRAEIDIYKNDFSEN
jgi:hypothetical protein